MIGIYVFLALAVLMMFAMGARKTSVVMFLGIVELFVGLWTIVNQLVKGQITEAVLFTLLTSAAAIIVAIAVKKRTEEKIVQIEAEEAEEDEELDEPEEADEYINLQDKEGNVVKFPIRSELTVKRGDSPEEHYIYTGKEFLKKTELGYHLLTEEELKKLLSKENGKDWEVLRKRFFRKIERLD